MPTNRPQKSTPDPLRLTNAEFRWFIMHFPNAVLKSAKINRLSFNSVAMTLSMFGTYATGENVSVTLHGLHKATGAHHKTITKVIDLLKRLGVLEVTGHSQSRKGGKPSEEFRLRKSEAVNLTLAKANADGWGNDTGEPGNDTGEPGNDTGEPGNDTGEDNRTVSTSSTSSNRSFADAPSPAPSSALNPDGSSAGAVETVEEKEQRLLDGIGTGGMLDQILNNL